MHTASEEVNGEGIGVGLPCAISHPCWGGSWKEGVRSEWAVRFFSQSSNEFPRSGSSRGSCYSLAGGLCFVPGIHRLPGLPPAMPSRPQAQHLLLCDGSAATPCLHLKFVGLLQTGTVELCDLFFYPGKKKSIPKLSGGHPSMCSSGLENRPC